MPDATPTAQDEVVDLCRDLLRIESVNDGTGRGPGERLAAEYVAEKLAEVGLEPQVFESAPGRTSVVARMEGEDSSATRCCPRPPRRRARRAEGVALRPVRGRDRRRLPVGARRRRHEGHGRDDPRGRPRAHAVRAQAAARRRAGLRRRRGGRRRLRRAVAGREPAAAVRGVHRGDQRGRRLLAVGRRRHPALPHRDGAEGHGLDPADRRGHRGPRLDAVERQRRHPAVRGGRAASATTSSRST